jgi:hypothetical protein
VAATIGHLATALLLAGPLGTGAASAAGVVVAVTVGAAVNLVAAPSGASLARFGLGSVVAAAASLWVITFLQAMGADPAPTVAAGALTVPGFQLLVPAARPLALGRPPTPAPTSTAPAIDGTRNRTELWSWAAEMATWAGAASVGVVALVATAPSGLLDPGSDLWHLPGGDRGAGVAGMRYFLADDWHWPLLLTDDLAAPSGTVIAFTDSIPILAVPTKAARSLLGSDLNYFPSWYLLAFTLQGVGAVALARSLGVRSRSAQLAAAAMAVQLPALVFRSGIHPSLAGHFIILLTLAAAFRAGSRLDAPGGAAAEAAGGSATPSLWDRLRPDGALLAVIAGLLAALTIHPYLFLMTALPVGGIVIDRVARGLLGLRRAALAGLATVGTVIAVLWAGGYLGSYAPTDDYGGYGLNILGPVWPQLSGVLPGHEPILAPDGTAEAYNWLGAGALALVAAAAALLVARPARLAGAALRWQATLLACATLTAFAISHRVPVGPDRVIDLGPRLSGLLHRPVAGTVVLGGVLVLAAVVARFAPRLRPSLVWVAGTLLVAALALGRVGDGSLREALSPVRASGRLWWPVATLIVVGAVAAVARLAPRRVVAPVLLAAAAVQAIDLAPVRDLSGRSLAATLPVEGAEVLEEVMGRADQVVVLPRFECTTTPTEQASVIAAMTIASAAGPVPIDTAYAARSDHRDTCDPATGTQLGPDQVLVLDGAYQQEPGRLLSPDHRCRDNGQLLVCTTAWAGVASEATGPFRPVVAEPRTFGAGGDAEILLVSGWGEPETWGRVIPDDGARVAVPLQGPVERPLEVRLRLRSTGDDPAPVIVTESDGTVHWLTAPQQGAADQVVAVAPPEGRTLELHLVSVGATEAGIDELTVLLG